MIKLKRAYEPPDASDGTRILTDRLWPRGVTKEEARLDGWLKDLAPSTELRKWFGHVVERWPELQRRHSEELAAPEKQALLRSLAETVGAGTVTLIYAARDEEHNSAVLLRDYLREHFQV
jgi:uncharacterized protein YeaO (DUF488 family)